MLALIGDVRSVPHVAAAGISRWALFSGAGWNSPVRVSGQRPIDVEAWLLEVTPGFIETLRIPLLAGRDLSRGDFAAANAPVLVNETFARLFLPGSSPLGRQFARPDRASRDSPEQEVLYKVVGVVGDAKSRTTCARRRRRRCLCPLVPHTDRRRRLDDANQRHARNRIGGASGSAHISRPRSCRPRDAVDEGYRHDPAVHARRQHHAPRAAAGAAVGILRACQPRARCRRSVWRLELFRRAADARDRHSDGARCAVARSFGESWPALPDTWHSGRSPVSLRVSGCRGS